MLPNFVSNISSDKSAGNNIVGKITGYTHHGLNQVIGRDGGRGVHPSSILKAINNPDRILEQAKNAIKYVGSEATVILNEEGKIITAFGKPHGPQIWNESGVIPK